jgi:hypothetical protein
MTDREFGLTTTPLPAIRSSEKLIQTTDKEWVGLTDAEIKEILDCGRPNLVNIKKAEQKLKEKNT